MGANQQQLPTVPADTNRLLNELERLAERVCLESSTPQKSDGPELVIRSK